MNEQARRAWLERLRALGASTVFAYGSIALIQLKVVWGIWSYRDLSAGDTASYHRAAYQFTHGLDLSPVYSPSYVAYFGALKWFVHDIYAVTIVHRLIIVFALTMVVLALFRALLPAGIAWALAVWWAVLPTIFDDVYEVHQFAAIPFLIAGLVAARFSGRPMRIAVLAILLFDAAFVRNEVIVAVVLWALAWIAYEIRESRRGQQVPWKGVALGLTVPALAVGALFAGTVLSWSGHDKYGQVSHRKHVLNVCQVYAFGYEQRHDDYRGEPFTECGPLMKHDFGTPKPSLVEAIKAHPGAIAEHFAWNLRLIPYGIEQMLFHRISSDERHNPDYVPVRTGSPWAAAGLVTVFALLLAGGVALWRGRRRWWREWIAHRAWSWIVLLTFVPTALVVIVTQRPRPSYLFVLTALIFVMIGTAIQVLGSRWRSASRLYAVLPVAALALLVFEPPYYDSKYVTVTTGRPLKAAVERLQPFSSQLQGSDVHVLSTNAFNVCLYLAAPRACRPVETYRIPPGVPLQSFLRQEDISFIYADEMTLANRALGPRLRSLEGHGWQRLAPPAGHRATWLLLRREQDSKLPQK